MKNNKFVAIAILTIFSVVAYGQQGKVHDWTDRPAIDGGKTTVKALEPKEKSREASEPREHHGGERDRSDTKTGSNQTRSSDDNKSFDYSKTKATKKAKAIEFVNKKVKTIIVNAPIVFMLKKLSSFESAVAGLTAITRFVVTRLYSLGLAIVFTPTEAGAPTLPADMIKEIENTVEDETQKEIKELYLDLNQSIDINRLIKIHDDLPSETQLLIDYYWERQEFFQIEKLVNQSIEMSKDKTSTYKSNYIHKGPPPSKNLPPGMKRKAEN